MKKEEIVWIVAIVILYSSLFALDKHFKANAMSYQQQLEIAIEQLNY